MSTIAVVNVGGLYWEPRLNRPSVVPIKTSSLEVHLVSHSKRVGAEGTAPEVHDGSPRPTDEERERRVDEEGETKKSLFIVVTESRQKPRRRVPPDPSHVPKVGRVVVGKGGPRPRPGSLDTP